MRTNYVLIDYENVQPKNLALLVQEYFRVIVFLGINQTKLPVDLVTAMQKLGERAHYIRMSASGPNALDFHIAYYIGRLACEHKDDVFFHIISKDTGFDPLITHLKSQGIGARRSATLDAIPVLRALTEAPRDEQVDAVVEKLKGMPKNRPQKERTLRATVTNWFGNKLDEQAATRIITELVRRKAISLEEGRVRYSLPG
ncbi:MAG: PIN domain-containing protein [Pseudoxanthomonas sp.]